MREFQRPLIRVLKTETALRKLGQVGHRIGHSLTSEATPKGPERTFTLGKGSTHPSKDCTHPLETSYNGLISAFALANDPISRHSTNCLKSRLATGSQKPAFDWPALRFSRCAQWPQSRVVLLFLLATARVDAHRLSRLIRLDFGAASQRFIGGLKLMAAPGLVDFVESCAAAQRPTLEEAESRPSPAGKAGWSVCGDSRSRALALSGQWALSKNYRVFDSFRFVASVALTVIAGGGGAESGLLRWVIGIAFDQWKQELLKWALRFALSNLFWPMGVGKGGRVCWALFSLPAARPHSPRRRGREGPDVYAVSLGNRGSAGATLGAIPAGSDARGGSGSLR